MKKYLGFLAVFLFATPALTANIVDFQAKSVTSLVLTTHVRTTSAVIGDFGSYYRLNCTVACSVAVSTTDFRGTFGVGTAATNYIYMPANETTYVKASGKHYIIGQGVSAGPLFITEMSP